MIDFVTFLRSLTGPILVQVIRNSGRQRLMGLASEMAYNAMLSLFPGIFALLTAITLFDAPRTAVDQLAAQIEFLAPLPVTSLIEEFVLDVTGRNQGLLSISSLGVLWASSSVVGAAMVAMDQIHEVPPKQRRPFWQHRMIAILLAVGSIAMLLGAIFLIFVSGLIVNLVAKNSGDNFEVFLLRIWQGFSLPMALGLVAIAFAFIYRWGPSRWRPGTPILPGAVIAAFCWAGISLVFRNHILKVVNYNYTYGTLSTVIILLLWLYLSSLAMLIGNQLNVTIGNAVGIMDGTGKRKSSKGRLGRTAGPGRRQDREAYGYGEEYPED
ncbi:MAG: YihY/virulence factor BrkB family protein [Synechococcales cyanobacterium RM1_1_8]|nr:YihY/virulence factor BrkB family protein [Synechococcales cyanobacterium RM1_1_8]